MTWYCSSQLSQTVDATLSRTSTRTHMLATYLERTGSGRRIQSRWTCRTLCKMNMFEIFWKDSVVKQEWEICSVSVVQWRYIRHRLIWSCWISIECHLLETGRENLITNQLMPAGRQQWYQQLWYCRLQAQTSRQLIHREVANGHLQRVT